MRQTELLGIVMGLKPGEAIKISARDMGEAAVGDLPALDQMNGARPEDAARFVAKIAGNWGVDMQADPISGDYTMVKR